MAEQIDEQRFGFARYEPFERRAVIFKQQPSEVYGFSATISCGCMMSSRTYVIHSAAMQTICAF